MIKYGEYNRLRINRGVDFGVYLGDDDGNEVLMPSRYVPEGVEIGDEIEAFVYFDSEDRVVATTDTPKAKVGEFAYLKAIAVTRVGAFLDWGLPKDLMLPYSEQKHKAYEGSHYLVRVYVDDKTNRIVATTKIGKYLEDSVLDELEIGQEVDIVVCDSSYMGYQVIINKKFIGILYKNEVFRNLEPGEQTKAYVRKIRWDDFKVDVRLQKDGYGQVDPAAEKVMQVLEERGGSLPLSDKSNPEDIYEELQMSKKVFKKAIGGLYKERKIIIGVDEIKLAIPKRRRR